MKVLIVEPNQEPREAEIDNNLKSLQEVVGGYIETVRLITPNIVLICNENGKLTRLKPNRLVGNDIIAGTFFIAGDVGEEFTDLTDKQILLFKAVFALPGQNKSPARC